MLEQPNIAERRAGAQNAPARLLAVLLADDIDGARKMSKGVGSAP